MSDFFPDFMWSKIEYCCSKIEQGISHETILLTSAKWFRYNILFTVLFFFLLGVV